MGYPAHVWTIVSIIITLLLIYGKTESYFVPDDSDISLLSVRLLTVSK